MFDELTEEQVMCKDMLELFDPFIRFQYNSLAGFKTAIFTLIPDEIAFGNDHSVVFAYKDLYRVTTRTEFIQIVQDLAAELRLQKQSSTISYIPLLQYFDLLKKDNTKIKWIGGVSSFYTFHQLLREKGVLTGHLCDS